VRDEWCLIAQLDGDERQIAAVASGLAGRGTLTRSAGVLRLYTDSEQAAFEAEQALLGLLEETELGYELWQERWDEEQGEWEELAPEASEDGESGTD
jgi:hypothetical protein